MRKPEALLTAAEKKKGRIIAEAAPAGFFAQHGVDTDFKTVGDLQGAIEVLGCYLHDLPEHIAERVYRRVEQQDSSRGAY